MADNDQDVAVSIEGATLDTTGGPDGDDSVHAEDDGD